MERRDVIVRVLAYVLTLEWLNGYRTYIGGAGFIFTGIGTICEFASNPNADVAHGAILAGVGAIFKGIAVIGQAAKQERLIAAAKEKPSGDASV